MRALVREAQRAVAVQEHDVAALGIRVEQLVHARDGEAAVLLAGRGEHDVADHVEGDVQRLGLVVPEVAHLKAALEHCADIEKAAVHRVAAGGHVVNVDIAVALRLKLLDVEKELLVELLVELVEDQAAARGDQRAVRVGVLLVADVHDRLGLFVDRVEHLHEIGLVIAVISVGLGHLRIDRVQRAFDDVVHLSDVNALASDRLALLGDKAADEVKLVLREGIQHPFGALVDCGNDLAYVKRILGTVLFDDVHRRPPLALLVEVRWMEPLYLACFAKKRHNI